MKKLIAIFSLALAFALTPLAANATILFVGGEDSDFILNNVSATTTAGLFSAGYAREAMAVNNGGGCTSIIAPPINYFMTPTFTASSIFWVHAYLYAGAGANCGNHNGGDVLDVLSPDGYQRIRVYQPDVGGSSASLGQFSIYKQNQALSATLLVSMTSPCFTMNHLMALDLYINYATSGEVTLYCNGAQVADYVGDVTTNSATQLNQVLFGPGDSIANANSNWSEIIVSTTNTRNMRVASFTPAANGNTTNWDTGGVSNVNESTLSTVTVNASGTSGQIQEYTVGSLPAGTFGVLGVWVNAQAQVDTTGPQHIQGMVRTGSTDYTSGNLSPQQNTWTLISTNWLTNPNTGVAWTTTDLGAAGFNIGFESQN